MIYIFGREIGRARFSARSSHRGELTEKEHSLSPGNGI